MLKTGKVSRERFAVTTLALTARFSLVRPVWAVVQGIWTEAKQKQEQGGAAASASSQHKSARKRKQEEEEEQSTVEHKSGETKPEIKELSYGDLLEDEYDEQFEQVNTRLRLRADQRTRL